MEIKSITTGQLLEMTKYRDELHVIDIREDSEIAEGMVPGTIHIPMNDLLNRKTELSKDKEYFIICRSGARSLRVCEFLQENGYKVVNIAGGMNAWFGEKVYPSKGKSQF
ncbi:MAG: sulfurtransferase [Bacillales bacterium]|jgi:rhodanese-related sulfurtransferase|nr:sulfurtransferase [Bacillales bacterium]